MSDERVRQPPAERFEVSSIVVDIADEVRALRAEPEHESHSKLHGRRQKTLYRHGDHTVALFVMDEGAFFKEHSASGTVTVQPIEGEIEMTVDGAPRRLGPGSIQIIAPGVRHDVRAVDSAVFLLQISLDHSSDD